MFRTTVSIDSEVYAAGQVRADKLHKGNFSKYLEALIEMDVRDRKAHVIVREEAAARSHNATLKSARRSFPATNTRKLVGVPVHPSHLAIPYYHQILAGTALAVAEENPDSINVPAGVAKTADFAVRVYGDSMEPLVFEGEVAVFCRSNVSGNGHVVAALVDGQMLLKLFKQKNGGPACLQSLNPKYADIPFNDDTRIQGIFEGKFDPRHVR